MSIWALLATIAEAEPETTSAIAGELKRVVGRFVRQEYLLQDCARFDAFMNVDTPNVRLQAQQHMFSDRSLDQQQVYQLVRYKIDHFQVDFQNADDAACVINGYVNYTTGELVPKLVNWYDLADVKMLLTATVQFSAKWKVNCEFGPCVCSFSLFRL